MGAIIRTFTGRVVDLSAPRVEDIHLLDISRGLSHLCRFAGQLGRFYSVAQHSIMVSKLVDPQYAKVGLMHDASEAYMGDLSRNLKHHPLLEGYRILEDRLQGVIYMALCIQRPTAPHVRRHIKAADDLAAIYERTCVRKNAEWRGAVHIYEAIDSGFVSSSEEDMGRLMDRLPHHWVLETNMAHRAFLAEALNLFQGVAA